MIRNQLLTFILFCPFVLMGCNAQTNTAPLTPSPITHNEPPSASLTNSDVITPSDTLDIIPAPNMDSNNQLTDSVPSLTISQTSSPITINLKDLTIAELDASGQPIVRPVPHKPETLARLIELTQQDLAKQLNIPTIDIELVQATYQEWLNSSLGCPQPGVLYTTLITPGYQLFFMVNNTTYTYHTDTNSHFTLCQ